MSDIIPVQREAAIATVVLNNPTTTNALGPTLRMRLGEVRRELGIED